MPTLQATLPIVGPYDLDRTMGVLTMGRGNPCLRHNEATAQLTLHTPEGQVAIAANRSGEALHVFADGPGSVWVEPHLAAIFGLEDDPSDFQPGGRLQRAADELAGLRLPRLPVVTERLIQVVLQQLISFRDACRAWRRLVQRYGEEVPGSEGLFHAPTAERLGRLAVHELMACDVPPKHARLVLTVAKLSAGLERLWDGGREPEAIDRLCEFLEKQPGIGPWTTGYLRGAGLGDADAVVLGDYGHPHQVAYFFTGEERGDDEQMLRLLEPYRPHRFRVLMLLILATPAPPRHGPKRRPLRERFR
ncbi:MAG: hypothetical protein AAF266_00280 [Planctomycetota bacterium]